MKKKTNFRLLLIPIITLSVIAFVLLIFKGHNFILVKYYSKIGHFKQKSKDIYGAIAAYHKVLALDTTFVVAYISQGSAYLDLRKYKEAITDYTKAATLTPNDAQIYAYRGRAYFEMGDSIKAMNDYDKSIALDNKFAYAYYNRGLIKYTKFKDFESACADFEKAADLGDEQAKDILAKGTCK